MKKKASNGIFNSSSFKEKVQEEIDHLDSLTISMKDFLERSNSSIISSSISSILLKPVFLLVRDQSDILRKIILAITSQIIETFNLITDSINSEVKTINSEVKTINSEVKTINSEVKTINSEVAFINSTKIVSMQAEINALREIQASQLRSLSGGKYLFDDDSGSQLIFFSQFGEDQWIVENSQKLPKVGFFLDIGTADGITFSNTYYFEKNGWNGICFEPSPSQFQKAMLFRKNVQQIAVGNRDEVADFHLSKSSPDWSSLEASSDDLKTIQVKCSTLESIIKKNNIKKVDLLSVDVEGTEVDVLEGFPFDTIKPEIIIVEYRNKMDSFNDRIASFMSKLPYELVHTTFANYIYKLK